MKLAAKTLISAVSLISIKLEQKLCKQVFLSFPLYIESLLSCLNWESNLF